MDTPIGGLPVQAQLDLDGLDLPAQARDLLFDYDREGWQAEFASIGEYLDSYGERMPEALKAEQRRIAESLSR